MCLLFASLLIEDGDRKESLTSRQVLGGNRRFQEKLVRTRPTTVFEYPRRRSHYSDKVPFNIPESRQIEYQPNSRRNSHANHGGHGAMGHTGMQRPMIEQAPIVLALPPMDNIMDDDPHVPGSYPATPMPMGRGMNRPQMQQMSMPREAPAPPMVVDIDPPQGFGQQPRQQGQRERPGMPLAPTPPGPRIVEASPDLSNDNPGYVFGGGAGGNRPGTSGGMPPGLGGQMGNARMGPGGGGGGGIGGGMGGGGMSGGMGRSMGGAMRGGAGGDIGGMGGAFMGGANDNTIGGLESMSRNLSQQRHGQQHQRRASLPRGYQAQSRQHRPRSRVRHVRGDDMSEDSFGGEELYPPRGRVSSIYDRLL